MPRAKLIAQSRDVLREHGIENHEKAMYLSLISSEARKSTNPVFDVLKTNAYAGDNQAWAEAIKIVFDFLKSYNLNYSILALQSDADVQPPPEPAKFTLEKLVKH